MNHGESFHLKSERRMLFRNIRVTLSRRGGERDKLDEKVRQLKQLQLKSPAPQFILMHLSSAFQSLWGQNTTKLMKNGQPNIFPSNKLPNHDKWMTRVDAPEVIQPKHVGSMGRGYGAPMGSDRPANRYTPCQDDDDDMYVKAD